MRRPNPEPFRPLLPRLSGQLIKARAAGGRLLSSRLLRNNAIFLAGSLGAGVLGYSFHFATGRLLGPAQYSVVASAVAALYIISLPSLVVQTVSVRFTSQAVGRGRLSTVPALLLQMSSLSLLVGGPIAIALVVFSGPASAYLRINDHRVIYVLAASSLVGLLVAACRGVLLGMRRFVALSINGVLDMGTRLLGATTLVVSGFGALGGLLALVAGPLVAYGQGLFLLRGLGSAVSGERQPLGDVGRYALLTTVAAVGTTYLYNADVILAKHYLSAQAAGIYAAASVLGRVVYFLGLAFAQVMFPEVATRHARNEAHFHVVELSLALLAVVVASLIAVYAAVPWLVVLPYGSAFDPVKPYLWPFALALGLLAFANLLVNYFLSMDSARFVGPLALACLIETGLILANHSNPGQILGVVILTMALLAGSLGFTYLLERFRSRSALT